MHKETELLVKVFHSIVCTDILDTKTFYSTLISSWLWLSMFFDCTLWLIVYKYVCKNRRMHILMKRWTLTRFSWISLYCNILLHTPNNSFSQLFIIIIKHKNFLLHFTWKLFLKPQQSIYVWNVKPYQTSWIFVVEYKQRTNVDDGKIWEKIIICEYELMLLLLLCSIYLCWCDVCYV